MKTQKVYELTTNADDGFSKYFVRGIKNDAEAKIIARKSFGKYYWDKGISYYDKYPSPYGKDWKYAPTKKKFLSMMKKIYRRSN